MAKAALIFFGIVLIVLILIAFLFPFSKKFENWRGKLIFTSTFLGGLIIVLSFIGFGTLRHQFYQIFAGQYVNDQYAMLTYYASLEKDTELMNYYYNKYDDIGLFFMESFYLGCSTYCDYDSAKAVTNFNLLNRLYNDGNISSISGEVITLNLIKVAL